MLESWIERYRHGDRLALSRLLTLAACGEHLVEIDAALATNRHSSRVVALTGSAGVGKSTLIGKSIEWLRSQGRSVAVLACDPQSPISGGALLGDRFRMPSRTDDPGIFIRSLAAIAGEGAVARHLATLIRLMEAFPFDYVLLETVGAGQGDTAVRELADVVVLLLQPETGDDLQWEKAGILEVVDVVAIHKADLPGAERVAAQVRAALDLSANSAVPVVRVSSKTGEGLAELWQAIERCPRRRDGKNHDSRTLLALAHDLLAARYAAAESRHDPRLDDIVTRWRRGELPQRDAIAALLNLLTTREAG